MNTKIKIKNIKRKIHDKIDTCAKINIINNVFVRKLNLIFCVDVNVIKIQNINDAFSKNSIVYFVQFVIIDKNDVTRYFDKKILNFDID